MSQHTKIKAPCSECIRDTAHIVLFHQKQDKREFSMIECCGCEGISMRVQDGYFTNETEYYPSPVSRQEPDWLWVMRINLNEREENIGNLMHEVYQALFGGQYRLAAMGIRGALEQVMIMKTGVFGSFKQNLNEFQSGGYISNAQRETVEPVLSAGHAAIHRGWTPTKEDLVLALDIVEGVLAPIFGHAVEAKSLGTRVPRRK